jgi:hypothetical protein
LKDREQVMNDYWNTVTREQLIEDLEEAGFVVEEDK